MINYQSKDKYQPKDSRLKNDVTIHWMRTRFNNKLRQNKEYLFIPVQIFQDFDIDKSGGLSQKEMCDAFNKYGIEIKMEQVGQLYKLAEVRQFTMESFKQFSFNENCNAIFNGIIQNIQKRKKHDYLPHSFIRMFTYLVYKIKAEEINKKIKDTKSASQQHIHFINLMKLSDLKLNNHMVNQQRKLIHQKIRRKLLDIYQRKLEEYRERVDNERYSLAKRMKRLVIDKMCPRIEDV